MEDGPEYKDLDRLFEAARKAELYKAAREHGFETRVLARIRETRTGDMQFLSWVWRLMPVFASLVVCLGLWVSVFDPGSSTDISLMDMSGGEETAVVSSLAGE